jgi:hypothetical protein
MAHLKDRIVQVLGHEADIIVMSWLVGYLPRRGKEGIEGADDEIYDDDEEQDQMRVTGRQFRHEPPPTAILHQPSEKVNPAGFPARALPAASKRVSGKTSEV